MTGIEKVARAIAPLNPNCAEAFCANLDGCECAKFARAAIEALREQSDAVEEAMAGQVGLYDPKHFTPELIAWEAWNAAIDALLNEKAP